MGKINRTDWNKVYRLTLIEDRTHQHIKFWRFSALGFLLIGITTLVVISLLFWSLISFTPLRTTVPGYPDAHFKRGAIANALKIDSLENEMTRWALYAGNLSRILAGEETLSADSLLTGNTKEYLRKLSEAEIARGDSLLRISVNNADDEVNKFLEWVLAQGTKYNHEYGLLNLDSNEASTQIEKVKSVLTAQK